MGQRLAKELKYPLSAKRINSPKDVESIIKKHKPKIIINAIVYTGKNNVDDCEKNRQRTLQSNTLVPLFLGEAVLRHKIKLVHLSSGCIYHYNYKKQKPITEDQKPDYYFQ